MRRVPGMRRGSLLDVHRPPHPPLALRRHVRVHGGRPVGQAVPIGGLMGLRARHRLAAAAVRGRHVHVRRERVRRVRVRVRVRGALV